MNKWKKWFLTVLLAVALNVLGRYITIQFNCPAYLNLTGTILAAYTGGPIIAGISAVLSCAACSLFSVTDWYFLVSDLCVAVAAGLLAKRNKYFEKVLLTISAMAFISLVKAFPLLIMNLIVYDGRTGFMISDGIIDFLGRLSFPAWLQYVIAAIYVGFTDAFFAMFFVWIWMFVKRFVEKKKRAAMLKKALGGKISLVLIPVLILLSLSPSLKANADDSINFVEKLYNSENGLTGGCLNDVAMTADGTMWIATYGGLYRFNGSKFVLIDNLKSVRAVQTLFVDEQDRLWAGTQDAGLTLLNIDMTFRIADMSTGLPSNSVKCISRDSNGLYYFGTTGGIATARFEDGEIVLEKVISDAGNIRRFSPDSEGRMFVMNNAGTVSCYEAGELVSTLSIAVTTPTGIGVKSPNEIYVGTDNEIFIYHYYGNRFHIFGNIVADGLRAVSDFYFDESGITYVAADNGIGYLDNKNRLTVIESAGFNNSIDHIFKDYQGNIWFTSARCGLLSLGRSSFTDVFKLCNEKASGSNAVLKWGDYLYVGTNDGIKILDINQGLSVKSKIISEFDGVRVRCFAVDKSDNLLAATYGLGIVQVSADGKVESYIDTDEIGKKIRYVGVLSDGTVVSSGDLGVTFMKNHKVKNKLLVGEELLGGSILNILETDDHTLLCGTDGDGVAVIKDEKLVKYISKEEGLPSGVVLRVVKDKSGDGYFIMTGSGMCYMDSDFEVSELGMPYYNNFDLVMNETGEVFVLGGAGIYVGNYDSLMANERMESYTLLDIKSGLPGSITSNAWNYVSEDGVIYICGTSGVYSLDLNNYEMKVDDFKTKITSIKRDGVYEDITQVSTIVIPKGTHRAEFALEINNYTTADPYVRYFMNGVDTEKTTVLSSKLESVTYYDIPYGDHEFRIDVLDDKGRILADQTYIISKERELYETVSFTVYFYLILAAFFISIVISIVQGALMAQNKRESSKHGIVVSQLEREKAEALERALHMEEEANRTKSEFLANMSHEIRTPINAILGMDTMIMRETGEDQIRGYARDIHSAGKTLLSLINDILDFSKIESGKLELVLGEYDLSALINDLVNMIGPKAEGKKIEFEVNVNPDIPNGLYGDEVRIEQIIINILNNAVKYTEKGKVTFNVDYEDTEGGAIFLKVSVSDTGIGIKKEDLDKLFSPYERIEEQRNRRIEGTGLGMSITKNLLDKMGSRLDVSSEYGKGSVFSFSIVQPVRSFEKIGDYREKAEGSSAVLTDVERYHAPDAKLLIVDDVEMNLIVAQNLLRRIKVGIDMAESGRRAVELAKENQYDIILLDSMMPEMNGEETMHVIRTECPLNEETPIIVLTAHAVKGAREEYLRLGYTNYLSKPLDGMKLEAMIESYLPNEKIIPVEEDEAAEEERAAESRRDDAKASLISKIGSIEGINAQKGIETSGGEDAYGVICRNFYDTAGKRIEMIREAYEKEDYENYTIQVHALKSSARLIGAYELSEEALALETAGREGDIELIKEKTLGVISKYEWFYGKLDEIFGEPEEDSDDREQIPEKDLKQNLSDMAELLEAFDFDTAKELFESMKEYRMPDDFKEGYKNIEGRMAEVDRDGILEIIHSYIG